MNTIPNFKELDASLNLMWPTLVYETLEKHGYSYFSECVYYEYVKGDRSLIEMEKLVGMAGRTIGLYTKKFGWPRKPAVKRRSVVRQSEEAKRGIIEMRKEGHSYRNIMKRYKVSHKTIRKVLEETT